MGEYPKAIKKSKIGRELYDMKESIEIDSKNKDSEIDEKLNTEDAKRKTISDLLKADEAQIKQAFQNWDTLTDAQFRAVTKKLFKAIIINEIQEDEA